tara:strand:- start:302 stop:3136 length:2835 start_codon:yes stop_codon:yes gene_type:complete
MEREVEQLPENPDTWTIEHVKSWALRSNLHAETAETLYINRINGQCLMRLTSDLAREMIPLVGPRMAFCEALSILGASRQDSSSSPSHDTIASTGSGGNVSGAVSQPHSITGSSPINQSHAGLDSERVLKDLHRRCGTALAKINEKSTALDASDGELIRDLEKVYGDGLCDGLRQGFGENEDDTLNVLRVAVLSIRPGGVAQGDPKPTLAALYTQWVDTIVSRTSYDAYLGEYPSMGECLAQLESLTADSSFPVPVFSSEERMIESLNGAMGRCGVSSVHIGIVNAYARRLWQCEGAANIGTFPPALFALKAMIVSKNDEWISLTSECPLRPVFNAGRQCGIVPPTERLAVLRCPAGPAAISLCDLKTACVVREHNMLVYLAERDPAHDRDSGAFEVDSLTEPLVRNYEEETGTWPLTIEDKVNLVKVLINNPHITVVPRHTIFFGNTVQGPAWPMLLKIIAKFPDLRIQALSDDGTSDQIQVDPIGEQFESSRSGSMATTFTPDPYAHFSGWVDCPWESDAYYIRQMEPRMTCHHNQRTGEVTCSDITGFLAIVIGTEELRKMELCEKGVQVLPSAPEGSGVLPVRCTFRGENPRYTLKYPPTGAALPDPDYVDMSPTFFARTVTQIKPKSRNERMQSAGPEVSMSASPDSARADTIQSAVNGDGADTIQNAVNGDDTDTIQNAVNGDGADTAAIIDIAVDSGSVPDKTRCESSSVDARPLKLRRKSDSVQQSPPGQPEAPASSLDGLITKPGLLPTSVGLPSTGAGLPQQQEIQVATVENRTTEEQQGEVDDVCDQCGLGHDIKGDRLYVCEASVPNGGECGRATHLKCMGLQKVPAWTVCRAHSEEFYTVRTHYRRMMQVATTGPRPTHTVTKWCREMRTRIMETCGYTVGETTVRDYLLFDPGQTFKPHNEQGSLKTNVAFNTYFQKQAHNSRVERGDNS